MDVTARLQLTGPSPFLPGTKIQFAWDSTSLTTAMACPQRYKLQIIEGWEPKNPNVAVALAFGIGLHYGIEMFHRFRAEGKDFDDAVHATLGAMVHFRDPRRPEKTVLESLPTDEDVAVMKESMDEEDDGIDLRNSKVRTRYHLFRALVWYFEHYRYDQMPVVILAEGTPAVEHSFRVPIGRKLADGAELLLSGHFDRLVSFNEDTFVTDTKSTKAISRQWRDTFKLSHQMTGYTIGGQVGGATPVKGVCIDGVALQVGGVKFDRFFVHRTKSQLAEYLDTLQYVAEQAMMWFETGFYPLNAPGACFFCQYKDICAQPPEVRQGYLNYYFERRPAWNPLETR